MLCLLPVFWSILWLTGDLLSFLCYQEQPTMKYDTFPISLPYLV